MRLFSYEKYFGVCIFGCILFVVLYFLYTEGSSTQDGVRLRSGDRDRGGQQTLLPSQDSHDDNDASATVLVESDSLQMWSPEQEPEEYFHDNMMEHNDGLNDRKGLLETIRDMLVQDKEEEDDEEITEDEEVDEEIIEDEEVDEEIIEDEEVDEEVIEEEEEEEEEGQSEFYSKRGKRKVVTVNQWGPKKIWSSKLDRTVARTYDIDQYLPTLPYEGKQGSSGCDKVRKKENGHGLLQTGDIFEYRGEDESDHIDEWNGAWLQFYIGALHLDESETDAIQNLTSDFRQVKTACPITCEEVQGSYFQVILHSEDTLLSPSSMVWYPQNCSYRVSIFAPPQLSASGVSNSSQLFLVETRLQFFDQHDLLKDFDTKGDFISNDGVPDFQVEPLYSNEIIVNGWRLFEVSIQYADLLAGKEEIDRYYSSWKGDSVDEESGLDLPSCATLLYEIPPGSPLHKPRDHARGADFIKIPDKEHSFDGKYQWMLPGYWKRKKKVVATPLDLLQGLDIDNSRKRRRSSSNDNNDDASEAGDSKAIMMDTSLRELIENWIAMQAMQENDNTDLMYEKALETLFDHKEEFEVSLPEHDEEDGDGYDEMINDMYNFIVYQRENDPANPKIEDVGFNSELDAANDALTMTIDIDDEYNDDYLNEEFRILQHLRDRDKRSTAEKKPQHSRPPQATFLPHKWSGQEIEWHNFRCRWQRRSIIAKTNSTYILDKCTRTKQPFYILFEGDSNTRKFFATLCTVLGRPILSMDKFSVCGYVNGETELTTLFLYQSGISSTSVTTVNVNEAVAVINSNPKNSKVKLSDALRNMKEPTTVVLSVGSHNPHSISKDSPKFWEAVFKVFPNLVNRPFGVIFLMITACDMDWVLPKKPRLATVQSNPRWWAKNDALLEVAYNNDAIMPTGPQSENQILILDNYSPSLPLAVTHQMRDAVHMPLEFYVEEMNMIFELLWQFLENPVLNKQKVCQ